MQYLGRKKVEPLVIHPQRHRMKFQYVIFISPLLQQISTLSLTHTHIFIDMLRVRTNFTPRPVNQSALKINSHSLRYLGANCCILACAMVHDSLDSYFSLSPAGARHCACYLRSRLRCSRSNRMRQFCLNSGII